MSRGKAYVQIMTNTNATFTFGSAAHRQFQVLELCEHTARVFESRETLITACRALRRAGCVTMESLGSGRWSVRITATGLARLAATR